MTTITPSWLFLDRSKSAEPDFRELIQNIDADLTAARLEAEFRRELTAGREAWDGVLATLEAL